GVQGCCYEVGEEVRTRFEAQFAYASSLFREVKESDPVREKYPLLFLTARAPGHGELPVKLFLDLVEANRRQLSAVLRELPEIKVYSLSPFDLDERRRFKDRFGGDIVYFLNDAACQECERLGLNLQLLAEISDDELPRRRTLVVGMPERSSVIGSLGHRKTGNRKIGVGC